MKLLVVVLVAILAASTVSAFSWSTFTGTSLWNVHVVDDQSGCDGPLVPHDSTVLIKHDGMTAEMGDWEHGPMTGSFLGNTFTIPDKTVPDSGGTSKLYNMRIVFTPDCLGFTSQYDWQYKDQYQNCHGTTTLTGKRADGADCPTLPKSEKEMIEDARAADAKLKEQKYADILATDPANFWANWDMAELKKQQGDYQAYLDYVAKAAGNQNILAPTAAELRKTAANSLHLSAFPTADKSPILRIEMDEIQNWNSGMIYNVNYRKPTVDRPTWKDILRRIFLPNSYNIVDKAVGVPNG